MIDSPAIKYRDESARSVPSVLFILSQSFALVAGSSTFQGNPVFAVLCFDCDSHKAMTRASTYPTAIILGNLLSGGRFLSPFDDTSIRRPLCPTSSLPVLADFPLPTLSLPTLFHAFARSFTCFNIIVIDAIVFRKNRY